MTGRGKLLVIGLALSLVVGVAATTSLAATGTVNINIAKLTGGKVRGLVIAEQVGANSSARVYLSLHRLTPNTR